MSDLTTTTTTTTTITTTCSSSSSSSGLDGLPKPFVSAMRTLFDIMDDQRSGYVKLSEIERRWQDDGAQGLPKDVLPSLRKVTPQDGYLSFERFCAGLQISLLRNKRGGVPLRKVGIRSTLQYWHKERTKDSNNNNSVTTATTATTATPTATTTALHKELRESRSFTLRGVGDGGASSSTSNPVQPSSSSSSSQQQQKKTQRKREARRHTLQNGVDANMLCRLKQLEAERDMLFQGCEVVERARSWYREQLAYITDRIHHLPHTQNRMEPSLEAQQERLHFQLARIHEVNSHLTALMAVGEGGGLSSPMHLPLAPSSTHPPPPHNPQQRQQEEEKRVVSRLKTQNHLLTEEVSNKSERITILEREKAALLRELLQARPHNSYNSTTAATTTTTTADSTFM